MFSGQLKLQWMKRGDDFGNASVETEKMSKLAAETQTSVPPHAVDKRACTETSEWG